MYTDLFQPVKSELENGLNIFNGLKMCFLITLEQIV